jgi:hypothetical protein
MDTPSSVQDCRLAPFELETKSGTSSDGRASANACHWRGLEQNRTLIRFRRHFGSGNLEYLVYSVFLQQWYIP